MNETCALLWRRLDTPGHDACRFVHRGSEWELEGTALFRHNGEPARMSYRIVGDAAWRTRHGSVHGFLGTAMVNVSVDRGVDGRWTMNGQAVPGLESHVHLDFGFTPATNFPQLQQLALSPGQAADLPVVWLDVPPGTLEVIPQRYERRSETACWYESPTADYAAMLELTPSGFIRRYPGLWELEGLTG